MTGFLCMMWAAAALFGTMLYTCLRDDIRYCNHERRLKQSMVDESNRIKKENQENPYLMGALWDVEEMIQEWNKGLELS